MLPQLKWNPLNDADMTQLPFEAKKRSFKCDYRGFGWLGGRNVADFFWGLQTATYVFKNKKNMFYVLWVDQIHAILAYFDCFLLQLSKFSLVRRCG